MIKLKRKVWKEWEELTTEEKVNLLKYKNDLDKHYVNPIPYIITLALFLIIITIAYFSIITSYHIQDIYNQTGLKPTNETLTAISSSYKSMHNVTAFLFYAYMAIIIIVMISFLFYCREKRKWQPFIDSLKKEKEVRY
jgi:hypothetical protein